MKKEIEENKKETCTDKKCDCNCKCSKLKWIIPIAVAVVAAIIVILCIVLGNKSNEKQLTKDLKTLGGQFYELFYYPAQEKAQKDITEFMAKFEKTGIKVNLENIAKVSKVDKKLVEGMVNSKTKKECDKQNSYVIIRPTSPYGKKDYKVEAYLSCGFDSKKDDVKTTTKKSNVDTSKKDTTTTKTEEKTTTKATKKTK